MIRGAGEAPIGRDVGLNHETLESAIESLIADIYVNHDGLAGRAAAVIAAADAAGDRRNADLGRLIHAELDNRGGQVPDGVRQAYAVLHASNDRLVIARAHAVLAGGLWRVGDNGPAIRHAFAANQMLTADDPMAIRVDHAIVLALQVNDQRIGGISHEEFRAAQALADASRVPSLVLANLNNWAWCSYVGGDLSTAADLVQRMRTQSDLTGESLNVSCADTVARVLLETGRSEEATDVIEKAIRGAAPTDSDAIPGALLTLAEIQRQNGDIAAAVHTLEECREIAERNHLPDVDAKALRMLAACHAGLGDFRTAYEQMVDFHEAWTQRRSEKSEIAARVVHAQFAVDEARRTTEQFREMAEKDALTGLWNRRRSDAELSAILGVNPGRRQPTCIALLDLDHFKRINDRFSHAAGDDVLCRVADVLRATGAHVGRHGGEEFVLIMSAELTTAAQVCEAIRATLSAYGWQAVADGLRVTVSIGLTDLRPEDDAHSVMRRADDLLYSAKRGGRDRVVVG